MGKTMTKMDRKTSKYLLRDKSRNNKFSAFAPPSEPKPKPKEKWIPHSERGMD